MFGELKRPQDVMLGDKASKLIVVTILVSQKYKKTYQMKAGTVILVNIIL